MALDGIQQLEAFFHFYFHFFLVFQRKSKKGGPKKALSAFMFFSKFKRKEILDLQPELRAHVADVSKMIGK